MAIDLNLLILINLICPVGYECIINAVLGIVLYVYIATLLLHWQIKKLLSNEIASINGRLYV